jgi:hypothetical protein
MATGAVTKEEPVPGSDLEVNNTAVATLNSHVSKLLDA